MKFHQKMVWVFVVAIISSCSIQNSTPLPAQTKPADTAVLTETPMAISPAAPAQPELITLNLDEAYTSQSYWVPLKYPNLWTRIDPAKMTVYYDNYVADYAYALDGSLWIVGDVGVVHQLVSGEQVLYSMQTGFPLNSLTAIAISPKGDVWVGGDNYALFRFDGSTWHDEGADLPVPQYSNSWDYQIKEIKGIDFDQDGNTWVITGRTELFVQVYGGWVNFLFPDRFIPAKGSGSYPMGFRVISEEDITIKRAGCCMSAPVGYHFDGTTWTEGADYSVVDQELSKRHHGDTERVYDLDEFRGTLRLSAWPVADKYILKGIHHGYVDNELISDDQGNVGIYDGSSYYSNSNGAFASTDLSSFASEVTDQDEYLLDFTRIIYSVRPGQSPETIFSTRDHPLEWAGATFSVERQSHVWFYEPGDGLYEYADGNKNFIAKNDFLLPGDTGGTLALTDSSILVGGRGSIWQYAKGSWSQWIIPNSNEVITFLRQGTDGTIFAAMDSGVVSIHDGMYYPAVFEEQDSHPLVVPDSDDLTDCPEPINLRFSYVESCVYHYRYSTSQHFNVKYLHLADDGSLIYVNNHIIARYENGEWKSFYFDLLEIESATVDRDGNLWVYAGSNGLFRFTPNVFDDYMPLTK